RRHAYRLPLASKIWFSQSSGRLGRCHSGYPALKDAHTTPLGTPSAATPISSTDTISGIAQQYPLPPRSHDLFSEPQASAFACSNVTPASTCQSESCALGWMALASLSSSAQ